MHSGLLFSIDALFAIGIVLATIVFVTTYASPPVQEQSFELARMQADDAAIVAYYTGEAPATTNLSDSANQGFCFATYHHALALDGSAQVQFDDQYHKQVGCASR